MRATQRISAIFDDSFTIMDGVAGGACAISRPHVQKMYDQRVHKVAASVFNRPVDAGRSRSRWEASSCLPATRLPSSRTLNNGHSTLGFIRCI